MRSQLLFYSDEEMAVDARSFTYCWNYCHSEFGDFYVVEVDDLTVPIQLDDASLFLTTEEPSNDCLRSQIVF